MAPTAVVGDHDLAPATTAIADEKSSKHVLASWQRQEYLESLRRQLEWYFSNASLATDRRLHRYIQEALPRGGWIEVEKLMRLKRIRELRASPQLIQEALQCSHLEVHAMLLPQPSQYVGRLHPDFAPRRFFVRRKGPLPPLLRRQCRGLHGLPPPDIEKVVLDDPFFTLNRLEDQWRVQSQLQLCEVGNSSTIFREQLSTTSSRASGPVLAVGYERVLYGDGGAYVELNEQQICWEAWPHFHDKSEYHMAYYDEYFTRKSYVTWVDHWDKWHPNPSRGLLMLYAQKHTVDDRPWAPGAAVNPHARREHGYADYRPGYFYMAADASLVAVTGGSILPVAPIAVKGCRSGSGSTTATGSDHSSPVGSDGPDEPASAAAFAPSSDSDASASGASDVDSDRTDTVQRPPQLRAVCTLAKSPPDWERCWEFQKGRCKMGEFCKWRHS